MTTSIENQTKESHESTLMNVRVRVEVSVFLDVIKYLSEEQIKYLVQKKYPNRSMINVLRVCFDLSGADLSGADLRGRDLFGADLSGADLSGADLSGADLFRADLSGADLSGADLSGADLELADLSNTKLEGVKLDGACLKNITASRNTYKMLFNE